MEHSTCAAIGTFGRSGSPDFFATDRMHNAWLNILVDIRFGRGGWFAAYAVAVWATPLRPIVSPNVNRCSNRHGEHQGADDQRRAYRTEMSALPAPVHSTDAQAEVLNVLRSDTPRSAVRVSEQQSTSARLPPHSSSEEYLTVTELGVKAKRGQKAKACAAGVVAVSLFCHRWGKHSHAGASPGDTAKLKRGWRCGGLTGGISRSPPHTA